MTREAPDSDLETLIRRFVRKGHAFAYRMLENGDDAADAVQESLSLFWARHASIMRKGDPAAWFFRVLRNRCIDELRRQRPRRHRGLDAVDPVDTAAGPEARVENDEFAVNLAEALKRLDAPAREILHLRDFQDLSYAEIATVLGIKPGTVMSRLHRARIALREQLKDHL